MQKPSESEESYRIPHMEHNRTEGMDLNCPYCQRERPQHIASFRKTETPHNPLSQGVKTNPT